MYRFVYGFLLVIMTASAINAESPFPAFEVYTIDRIGSSIGQTSLADVDKDGDLDWIAGCSRNAGSAIWWFEYQGPDKWIRHDLGKGNTDVGGSMYDVNQDGWIDMVSGSKLLLNTGKPRTDPFKEYEVGAIYSHDTEFADIDKDGKMDVIANSDESGLFWYTIPKNPTEKWISHLIASAKDYKIHGSVSPKAVGDLDGDGDNDVVTGQAWYENADGKGLKWIQHKNIDFGEKHQYGIAVRTWVLDMDGDGDEDFVQAEADNPDARVAWFENDGKGNWTRHIIKDKGEKWDFHSLALADFDLDGDMDIYAGAGPLSAPNTYACFIWENKAGAKARPTTDLWVEHKIAQKPCHEAKAADVDGDGDIDICTKPWEGGNEHLYLRNMLKENQQK